MPCPNCDQGRKNKLCQECRLEDEHEYHQKKAEEMADGRRNSHANATLQMLREAEEKGIDGAAERIAELNGGGSE